MPAPKRRWTAFVVAIAVLIATPLAVMAADQFSDVPDSNVHHDDITWLADANVTKGCNPPDNTNFCPEDPVLRQQMASFLRRLAENQVVDAATAITADSAASLDGKGLDEVQSAAFGASCASDCEDALKVMSLDIDAPAAGVAKFDYSISIFNDDTDDDPQFAWLAAGDTCETIVVVIIVLPANAAEGTITQSSLAADSSNVLSGTTVLSVPAGEQTYSLCQLSYSSDFDVVRGAVTAVWAPADSSVPIASSTDVVTFTQEEIDRYTQMFES